MAFEKDTIEYILLGDTNEWTIHQRVKNALINKGKDTQYIKEYIRRTVVLDDRKVILNNMVLELKNVGYSWGKTFENQDIIAEAVLSGRYDNLTVKEMKQRLKI